MGWPVCDGGASVVSAGCWIGMGSSAASATGSAVVGAGVAAGLVGGGLHLLSEKNFNDFDAMVERDCKNGCPNLPTDQVDRARLQRNVAIASYATGGAVLATGFVLVYLNRIKLERIDVTAASERQISLIPMISPGAAGVTTRFRF